MLHRPHSPLLVVAAAEQQCPRFLHGHDALRSLQQQQLQTPLLDQLLRPYLGLLWHCHYEPRDSALHDRQQTVAGPLQHLLDPPIQPHPDHD